jgi:glyoxylase I family protein
MFQGLEHTAIATANPEKLAQWYVDYLGFHINFSYAGNFFVKAPNGSMLELIPAEAEMKPQTAANFKNPGIRHLAIAVDDFDAAHAQLKGNGVQFLGEPINNQGNRLAFFNDGDGNILHLISRVKPLP